MGSHIVFLGLFYEYYVVLRIPQFNFLCYRALFLHLLKRAQGGRHDGFRGYAGAKF